jgi:hypothetical protein
VSNPVAVQFKGGSDDPVYLSSQVGAVSGGAKTLKWSLQTRHRRATRM